MPHTPLTRVGLRRLLGPVRDPGPLNAQVIDEVVCDGYTRQLVSYDVPSGRVTAFVCIPTDLQSPAPVVFCHHQHAGQFNLGKSEVCGLRGDPDQAYAAELAQRGFLTIAPDAIGFEDRNWAHGQNVGWYELADRLVHGRTLLADCLQEVSLALDYASTLPEVDSSRIGFIGHSYGGRTALWAPAWDDRIRASVSNCGCITYRESFTHDAGMPAEFVIPGFAVTYDLEDVISAADQCAYLVIAAEDDTWSRGAQDLAERLDAAGVTHARVHVVPGDHDFPRPHREGAYAFLEDALSPG